MAPLATPPLSEAVPPPQGASLVTLPGPAPLWRGRGLPGHAPRAVMRQQPLGVTRSGAARGVGTPGVGLGTACGLCHTPFGSCPPPLWVVYPSSCCEI